MKIFELFWTILQRFVVKELWAHFIEEKFEMKDKVGFSGLNPLEATVYLSQEAEGEGLV